MNVKRGLIRLSVLFSAVWCLSLLGLSASDWYHATSYWYRSRGFAAKLCDSHQANELYAQLHSTRSPPPPTAASKEITFTPIPDCFEVIVPNGSKYIVAVAQGGWTAEQIKDMALHEPKLFATTLARSGPGDKANAILIDLTRGNPLPGIGGFLAVWDPTDHPNLQTTILAFGVPFGVLILGGGLWWAAMGFRLNP